MACPKCGCKTTYAYCEDDILGLPGDQERCANCGSIFFVDAEDDDDDDDDMTPNVCDKPTAESREAACSRSA
jgi:hypothetical protein